MGKRCVNVLFDICCAFFAVVTMLASQYGASWMDSSAAVSSLAVMYSVNLSGMGRMFRIAPECLC